MGRDELIAMADVRIYPKINVDIGNAILEQGLEQDAISLSAHHDPRIAFRVSWGLEHAYFRDTDRFRKLRDELFGAYLRSGYDSTHRVYGKIVYDILRRDDRQVSVNIEPIAGKAFDLLVSDRVNVASKVWAMEILYLFYRRLDWVTDNLVPTLEHQAILSLTPAMLNHTAKVLRRIKK